MANRLADFIDSYMHSSEIYSTYWQLYRHSQAKSAQKVRDILSILEEDIRKFTEGARKFYFTKNTGTFLSYTRVTSSLSMWVVLMLHSYPNVKNSYYTLRCRVPADSRWDQGPDQLLENGCGCSKARR